jgi:dihydropteroate synthase
MNNAKYMGVINITPDSFSEPSRSYDSQIFLSNFHQMTEWADIIDIGAESTAPMNSSITEEQELERFQKIVFPVINVLDLNEKIISIDTYKPQLFVQVAEEFLKHHPQVKLIWNDVSGKLDSELLSILKNPPFPFTYVYSHNLASERAFTGDHMSFVSPLMGDLFLDEVHTYFQKGIQILNEMSVPYILDPCFGFSKSREQNQFLLKNILLFFEFFPTHEFLIGISRKSFLRFPTDSGPEDVENLQTLILNKIRNIGPTSIFRIHSPSIKKAMNNFEYYF